LASPTSECEDGGNVKIPSDITEVDRKAIEDGPLGGITEVATILIVDDNPTNLILLGNILEKSGFTVRAASSGQEALECAMATPLPKLVLLDILMPEMDGYETCRRLKTNPLTSPIPVIFVTALGMVADKLKGFQSGAVDFITKPYEPEEVMARVRTHLSLARMEELAAEIEVRRRSEEALRESEALLKMSQRIGHLGSWKWHLPSNRLSFSEETLRIFGVVAEEAPNGMDGLVLQVIHPDDRQRAQDVVSAARKGLPPGAERYRILHKDGSIRHVWVEPGKLETGPDGTPLSVFGIARDVTEAHLAQLQRQQLEADLAHSRKLEALGLMAGGIAHDFNNMLGVIFGHAELAQRRTTSDPSTAKDLEAILKAAHRCAELIRQLLTFASKDAIQPRIVQADDVIGTILESAGKSLPENIAIHWLPGAGDTCIRIDPSQLEQILSNILVNSAEASAPGKAIRVSTSCDSPGKGTGSDPSAPPFSNRLAVVVEDEGCGIPPDIMERIFDPFFTTKPRGKGVGLGLSTVLGAVRQNGGHIEAASQPGRGSTFRILFPSCEPLPAQSKEPQRTRLPSGVRETILVVEDHPDVLEMTTMVLQHLGFQVVGTTNPWQALDLLRTHQGSIQLLLTDVVMPGIDGRELGALARREFPGLRLLLCSGYMAGNSTGCDCSAIQTDLIQKPYSIHDLHCKIREILDRD